MMIKSDYKFPSSKSNCTILNKWHIISVTWSNGKNLSNCWSMHIPNFWGLSGSEDRGGGDYSVQFINFGRVGDKSFEKWQQKIGGWKGG